MLVIYYYSVTVKKKKHGLCHITLSLAKGKNLLDRKVTVTVFYKLKSLDVRAFTFTILHKTSNSTNATVY